ncbi:MAG: MFS transporter [Patescibacteria group bacterium]
MEKEKSSITGLMWLVATYYFLQGMGGNPGLHSQALELFLKKSLLLNPMGQASFFFIITIPWMIKPLYGMISDFLPIFGYRRASYFVIASILSVIAYVLVVLFGYSYLNVVILLTISSVGFAFSDVLCDAVMVEKGQPLNATDKLQSAQWAAISVASVILMFSGGYIAQYLSLQTAVLLSLVFPICVLLVTIFFLKEKKAISVEDSAKKAWQGLKAAFKMKAIWGCAIFIFVFYLCPSFGTALYNYQIDKLKFTQVNIGHIRTVGSIGFLLGVLFFMAICGESSKKKNFIVAWLIKQYNRCGAVIENIFRRWFETLRLSRWRGLASVVFVIVATIEMLFIIISSCLYGLYMMLVVELTNKLREIVKNKLLPLIIITAIFTTLAYLFYYNLTSAFIIEASTAFVGAMAFVGILVIAARVCPKYAEGTVFALLMSVSNLGKGVANIIGGHLYEVVGYHWLVAISAISVACTWFLLPLVRSNK